MKLSQCELGKIVVVATDPKRIGHIVSLAYSVSLRTIIPLVLFAGEQVPTAVNHDNLSIYKDS